MGRQAGINTAFAANKALNAKAELGPLARKKAQSGCLTKFYQNHMRIVFHGRMTRKLNCKGSQPNS